MYLLVCNITFYHSAPVIYFFTIHTGEIQLIKVYKLLSISHLDFIFITNGSKPQIENTSTLNH
jgi:hypothetical protein